MQVEKSDVAYKDIGWQKGKIGRIEDVVELPILNLESFEQAGFDPPKGVLLYYPPGTGKTLIVWGVANNTDNTFLRVIGSALCRRTLVMA